MERSGCLNDSPSTPATLAGAAIAAANFAGAGAGADGGAGAGSADCELCCKESALQPI